MPPLTRQQTSGSVRSWWSDSNPHLRGPTINLHAAAKPLMKFLYNRQALEFIRTIDSIPLSAKDAEIYGSYLSCEYVSASTKSAILEDLDWRAHYDIDDALVMHSNMFHDILQLLEVPEPIDTKMSKATRGILQTLAKREATTVATCSSLVALLCDSDVPQVVDGVLSVLSSVDHIKFPPVTSGVSVEAKLLDRLSDMLEEDSSTLESHHWWILGLVMKLARYESTAVVIAEAGILNYVEKLLRSQPAHPYWYILPMVESLASHESTAMAVVRRLPLYLLGDCLLYVSVDLHISSEIDKLIQQKFVGFHTDGPPYEVVGASGDHEITEFPA
ncbi:hypothetical protein C8J57DRAFT_1590368 [Mycena rebaudengoi]|nr:hypothetical protein C8J57DRAFT_1590368 [Mycena rebaudengoi]